MPFGNALGHVFEYLFGGSGAAGIVAVHIPVEVLVTHRLQLLGQPCHNTFVVCAADGIGTAARETGQHTLNACILLDLALYCL